MQFITGLTEAFIPAVLLVNHFLPTAARYPRCTDAGTSAHVYKLQKLQLARERSRRTNFPLNKRSSLEKDRAICLRKTQQLPPCDSPWEEPGRREAAAAGRGASPLRLTGLQPQPRAPRQPPARTPAGATPGKRLPGAGRKEGSKGRWDGRALATGRYFPHA